MQPAELAEYNLDPEGSFLECRGAWTSAGINTISNQLQKFDWPQVTEMVVDGDKISQMDSAGAWLLAKTLAPLKEDGAKINFENFANRYKNLLELVQQYLAEIMAPLEKPPRHNWLYRLGETSYQKYLQADDFLIFIGELAFSMLRQIRYPQRIQWASIINNIYQTGYQALGIIAFLSLLIGVVLAYQMGVQLEVYGANVFIVNLTGIAILREFGPLIASIIVAGRTASSYTAFLGTMKVNEEIDALRTMGISPIDRLVLPRIFGLMIAFPLLTFWSDIFGVIGSMVMAKVTLGIHYHDFMTRFQSEVKLDNYIIGLVKAPVFALVIGAVGCFQGFRVSYSADSVGLQTTKSVVQALFLIIIVDALFSVFFSMAGI